MTGFKDVFISYGRPDSKAFAIKLQARLVEEGFSVWLDLNDIPLAVDFQKHIDTSLHQAHNFLFVVSPHAVNSPYCGLEVERALKFNKRIIPLIHVEEISRETWQQRNPNATDADWEAYKAKGHHSIYPNMRPAIQKLNWAFFQEENSNFEQAVQNLSALLKIETDYIHQHTYLLNRALAWTENQNQTRYLLTGKLYQAATAWLTTKNDLASCQPSDLHCEYICQSIKNAQNLMCQVFLSYATAEDEIAQTIRRSLSRHAITVWTSRTDILTGEDFQTAIRRGIEQADNLVYLISPSASESQFCQDELEYALSLNKRIIPVLARPTEADKIPPEIRQIQYIESIDLTDNLAEEDYTADEDKLLEALKRDAPYHQEHKELLVKALKWERQEDNPSILLRHHSLRHYTAWLKLAQQRKAHGPTQLQKDFVEASTQQPPDVTVDVFIASSSADIDFARKLNETLQIQGQSTWFEQESLLTAADSDQEITNSIAASENFVFLLSPDSAASEECMGMLHDAVAANKRVLVVLYAATHGVQPSEAFKDPIVFDFRQQDEDFLSNFGKLYRALESNPEHIREHTRLSMRANEWKQEDYDDSFLLRGKTLASAETWLKDAENNTPQPTELQRRYIRASREQPLRRVSPLAVGLWGAAATLIVGAANMLGAFQPVELAAYGHLLRQRSAEDVDDRFLIVKVDRTSGFYLRDKLIQGDYEPGISSIPDQALLEGLQALEANEPRLIGLDFYRDFPAKNSELAERLRSTENVIGICKATAGEAVLQQEAGELSDANLGGYEPIKEVAINDYPNRIGFNDLLDDGHILVRRHYLIKEPDPSVCQVQSAFSLLLARHYLDNEGVKITGPELVEGTQKIVADSLKIGPVTVPQLRAGGRAGSLYFLSPKLKGYQTLLNFRQVDGDAMNFATSVSFKDLLNGRVDPELIRDRIVLIGYTDLSDNNTDSWNTPYGEMPGVFLHGQMSSQLISAALDKRPLIRWVPFSGEWPWLLGWSLLGGFIVWGFYRPLPLILATGGSILLIYVISWGAMVGAAWVLPMVPAISTLFITGGIIIFCNHRLRKV